MILYLYRNVYEKKSTSDIYNFLVLITNTIWQEQVYPSQYFLNILFDSFSTGWKQFHIFLYYFFVHERWLRGRVQDNETRNTTVLRIRKWDCRVTTCAPTFNNAINISPKNGID